MALSYIFMISEIVVVFAKRSKQKTVKKKNDRGSLIILWIVITGSLTLGFYKARYETWVAINYLVASFGMALFSAGSLIRWLSIIQLKKAFTVDVVISREHKLKMDGLYSLVRHPGYLGLLLILTGLSAGMNSFQSFFIVTVPVSAALLYRIAVEEKMLIEEFGSGYCDYIRKTKKIIPYIY
jgi:protein-S-isoprenylcysteine O-methyltransferase Ste14